MKRSEEIQQKAREEAWYIADTSQTKEEAAIRGYCLGVAYADRTMLDRAENYLRSKLEYRPILKEEYIHGEDYIRHRQEQSRLCDEFITAFRQAMEGGAE
jgi:hypothetical protein